MPNRFDYTFTDMHCHILPGVDDGSVSMDMSLDIARALEGQNVSHIIVTPHNYASRRSASPDGIRRRVEELQWECDNEGIDLTFFPGNELFYDSTLPERLTRGEALTLADSQYCLVEFYPTEDYQYILNGLRAILYEGFKPVLAHCERYICLSEKAERAQELTQQGVLLQVNASSVRNRPGHLFEKMPAFVNRLLKDGLVSFVSSDAHRESGSRGPAYMLPAAEHILKKYGDDAAYNLFCGNSIKYLF